MVKLRDVRKYGRLILGFVEPGGFFFSISSDIDSLRSLPSGSPSEISSHEWEAFCRDPSVPRLERRFRKFSRLGENLSHPHDQTLP